MKRFANEQASVRGAWARARVHLIPVLVLLAITVPHLGQGDFRTDTGWYSAIGLSTVRSWGSAGSVGELLSLQAEPGKPFFNKPPLALWIHGLVLHVFGVSLWAARLPTVVAACGCVALTAASVRRMGTRSQAMMAGVVLALTLEFFRRTKEVSLDMWQLLFMLGAVWVTVAAAARRWERPGVGSALLSGALIGLSLLCKPLVGLLGSLILIAWLLMGRRLSTKWAFGHIGAAVIVALPWYLVMSAEHGDAFVSQHFVGEVAERAAGITTAGEAGKSGGGAEPAWFYVKQLGETYWPWLVTMALGLVALARGDMADRARRIGVLAALWFAAWLVLLTAFPDRRPRYALVLWPAGAVLSGLWMGLGAARGLRPLVRAVAAWGACAAMVGGAVFAALPVRVQRPAHPQWPALFEWMERNQVREIWQGGLSGPSASRVYLRFAEWPVQTQDREGRIVTLPPEGAFILYHRRDGLAPGSGEVVAFREGDLSVTRLERGPWQPLPTADPGEPE